MLAGRAGVQPAELEKLAETTKTDIGDWGFTAADGVEVRATAPQNAPVIEKLGMQFVRVMPDMAPNASQDFMRVVTPSGKVGFVAAEAINPLGSDQLCYGKDAAGRLEDRRHDRRRIAPATPPPRALIPQAAQDLCGNPPRCFKQA